MVNLNLVRYSCFQYKNFAVKIQVKLMRSNVGMSDTVANPVSTIPVQDLTLNTKEIHTPRNYK